jgi:hypothetical protein
LILALCLALTTASLEEDAAAAAADPAVADQGVSLEPQSPDRVGRVAAELGAALLGLVIPNILWMPFLAAQLSSPFGGGSSGAAFAVMAVIAVLLEPISLPTSVWLVLKKMGGKGGWPSAFGGGMLGIALGSGLVGAVTAMTTQGINNRSGTYVPIAAVGGVLLAIVATVFMIELHNDQTVTAAVAPVPGGAVGMIGARF